MNAWPAGAVAALVLVAAMPASSSGEPQSRVTLVKHYQRYAGEEGLGIGFGSLWVSGTDNGESVARMNLRTSKSVSIDAPSDEDSQIGIARDAVWMSDFGDGVARRIDPATNRVTATTKGLAGASGFAFSGNDVWVALHHGQAVADLDGKTAKLRFRIAVPQAGGGVTAGGPGSVAVGFGTVWTSVPNLEALVRLDPVARKAVAVIHRGSECCGAVVVAGGGVWAASGTAVERIDPATNRVSARVHIATQNDLGASLAVLDGNVWATEGGSIVELDAHTGHVLSRTRFANAFFTDLAAGNGALWAWDGNTNQVDELRVR